MKAALDSARRGNWFITATGRQFFPLDPRPEEVSIRDISRALSKVCRFGGHTRVFYSVAQHSVHVSKLVPEALALHGLMHDAAEAYVGDVIRPIKRMLEDFARFETGVARAIEEAFGIRRLTAEEQRELKHADNVALITERRDLIAEHDWPWHEDEAGYQPDPLRLHPMTPTTAEMEFLSHWRALGGKLED